MLIPIIIWSVLIILFSVSMIAGQISHRREMRKIYRDSVEFWTKACMENPTRERVLSLIEAYEKVIIWS